MTDAIDFSAVTLLRSVDPRAWPITTAITAIDVSPSNIKFDFTKKDGPDRWPDQPFGKPEEHGSLQYTVWLFLNLGGKWFGAGFIEMWHDRDGVGDSIGDFHNNWYDPRGFWGPMTGHVVQPGELIGFMVTPGNARLDADSSVHERSAIVTIAAPEFDRGLFTFPASLPVPLPPPVPPSIPPTPDPVSPVAERAIVALNENTAALLRLSDKIAEIQKSGIRAHL
jgi:hypothetical protein